RSDYSPEGPMERSRRICGPARGCARKTGARLTGLMPGAFAMGFCVRRGGFGPAFPSGRRRTKTLLQSRHEIDHIARFSRRSDRHRPFAFFLPPDEITQSFLIAIAKF